MRAIITAGGTGGHIYPAIAIIEKLKENKDSFLYIGTTDRMESNIIPSMGYEYVGLEINGFRRNIKANFKNITLVYNSYKKALKTIKEYKPDVVIGFGGYVTFPVIMAARKLKIPTMIHEQNYIPGKTNKFLGKFCDKVFVSFKDSEKYFNKNKVIYSFNPAGERAVKIKRNDKTKLGFKRNKKLIIIVMGSLGSSAMNDKLYEFLKTFKSNDKEILFIAGKDFYKKIDKRKKMSDQVKIIEYYNNLPGLMKDADLIISRAGASTISEIEALKIPSILIPSPYVANNHQYFNAMDLKKRNIAYVLEEKDVTAKSINDMINDILDNKENLKTLKENLNKNKTINGVDIIYNEMKKTIRR